MKKRIIKFSLIGLGILFILIVIFAKSEHISPLALNIHNPINQAIFSSDAINRYDPVSFFKNEQIKQGSVEFSYKWNEATWYFSSKENLDLFAENPINYSPQYGGYCSFAISKGFTAKVDPTVYELIDNKLYLFSADDVRTEWKNNLQQNIITCNTNWK